MTERERWIVYPLLFLALGAALRDKLVDRTTTKSIICEELAIVDEEPTGNQPARLLAKMGREPRAGGAAYFWIDGNVDIIEGNPADGSSPRTLVKLGRTEPSQGVKSIGFAAINGHVLLGNVFMPSLPGGAVPSFLNELPASPGKQQSNQPEIKTPTGRPQASPPADKSADTAGAPANSNSPRETAPQK